MEDDQSTFTPVNFKLTSLRRLELTPRRMSKRANRCVGVLRRQRNQEPSASRSYVVVADLVIPFCSDRPPRRPARLHRLLALCA
jgi:hypothetical protein